MALTPEKTAELDKTWEETQRLQEERLAGSKQSYEASQKAAETAASGKDAAMKNVAQEASRAVSSTIAATPAGSGLRLTAARGTALERAAKEGSLGAELDAQIAAAEKLASEAKKTYADEQQEMNKVKQEELQAAIKANEQADLIAEAEYQKWLGDPNAGPRVAYYTSTAAKLEQLLPTLVNPEARKAIMERIQAIKDAVAASGGKLNEM